MRYRTIAVLCFGLLALFFGLPPIVWKVFLPSLKQNLPGPIPLYERVLLEAALFCGSWKWLLLLPLTGLGLGSAVADLTARRVRR